MNLPSHIPAQRVPVLTEVLDEAPLAPGDRADDVSGISLQPFDSAAGAQPAPDRVPALVEEVLALLRPQVEAAVRAALRAETERAARGGNQAHPAPSTVTATDPTAD